MLFIHPDGRAAGQTPAGLDLFRHVREQFRARLRIRVHENQPVAGGRRRAGIPGAGDLIDRLKHDGCARRARDFRRPVGGIVVADDEFALPTALGEDFHRRFHRCERPAEQPFLVERGNDDRNFHGRSLAETTELEKKFGKEPF